VGEVIDAKRERGGHDGGDGRNHSRAERVAENRTEQGPADDNLRDRDDEHLGGRIRQDD
jgi:hypothetical protein